VHISAKRSVHKQTDRWTHRHTHAHTHRQNDQSHNLLQFTWFH